MTYSHLLTAVLSFAVGVLVMDTAHDIRAAERATSRQIAPTPAQMRHITPLLCEHLRGRYNPGCV